MFDVEPAQPAENAVTGHVSDARMVSAQRLPLFSRAHYERAAELRTDKDWLAEAWTRAQVLVLSSRLTMPVLPLPDGGRALVWRASSDVRAPAAEPSADDDDVPFGAGLFSGSTPAPATDSDRTFLGLVGDVPYFAVTQDIEIGSGDVDGEEWLGLRDLGATLAEPDAGMAATALGLAEWHKRHQRCPLCGATTRPSKAGWTRVCTVDSSEHFPRTDAAVIMLVHDGAGRCVLGRQNVWPAGRYSVLAGFVEPGESLEAAVAREVYEEVGLRITDIRYVASQPWPFPASLMLGFIGRVDGSTELHVDGVEIENARWFRKDELDEAMERDEILGRDGWSGTIDKSAEALLLPGAISIARLLIERWVAGLID